MDGIAAASNLGPVGHNRIGIDFRIIDSHPIPIQFQFLGYNLRIGGADMLPDLGANDMYGRPTVCFHSEPDGRLEILRDHQRICWVQKIYRFAAHGRRGKGHRCGASARHDEEATTAEGFVDWIFHHASPLSDR